MSPLRRVLGAPGLLVGLWLGQLLVAWQLGAAVRATAAAATERFSWVDDGHLLHAVSELLASEPAVGAALVYAGLSSAFLGLAFWTLAYGGVIARLAGKRPLGELAAVSVRCCPGIAVQSLWVALFRGAIVALLALAGMATAPAAALMGLLGLCFTVALADLARVNVVLRSARPFHPATAVRAIVDGIRRPRLLLGAGALSLGQYAASAAGGYLVAAGLAGPASLWLARLLAGLGLALGLWRIALAVDTAEERGRP